MVRSPSLSEIPSRTDICPDHVTYRYGCYLYDGSVDGFPLAPSQDLWGTLSDGYMTLIDTYGKDAIPGKGCILVYVYAAMDKLLENANTHYRIQRCNYDK